MTGVKISALPAASAANDTDQIEVNQSGTSRRVTVGQVRPALSPLAFGAIGDGVTDDTAAFVAMRAAGGNSGVYQLTPGKTFLISSPFTLLSNETVIGWGSTIKVANACTAGIVLGSASSIYSGTLMGVRVTKDGTWNTGDIGISCVNCADALFENVIVDRFEYGIYINPPVGARVGYCTWLHPEINRCRVNWRIIVDDTGFVAECKVISGRLAIFSDAPVPTQYNIHATRTGTGSISHWYWLSPSMEGSNSPPGIASVLLENVRDWVLESPRTEGTWTSGFDIQMDAACLNNRIALDYTATIPVVSDLGSNIVTYRGFTKPIGYFVNNLPAAASWTGAEAYVTNSATNVIGAIPTTGGANKVKVMSNGTNWLITAAV